MVVVTLKYKQFQLFLLHVRFLYLCFCPCFSHWFEMGGAKFEKGDITYFCAPTIQNVMTIVCNALSHQITPTQS